MNREDMNLHILRTPFIPFRVLLSTNESFDVRHPEMAVVTDRFISIGRPIRNSNDVTILIHWISLQHIVYVHRLT